MTYNTYFWRKALDSKFPTYLSLDCLETNKKKPTYVPCHISQYEMTLFNGTVRKTALYSVLGSRERRIYLRHARENKRKLITSIWSSIYFRLL